MVQFHDIVVPWEIPKRFGETLEEWRERQVEKYTPKFKELVLFNDSMGHTHRPMPEVLKETGITLDEFCEGYVEEVFDGISQEAFEDLIEE